MAAQKQKGRAGFTLIEMIVVIALIAAGAGTGGYFLYRHFSE